MRCLFCKIQLDDPTKEQGYCSEECRELGTRFFVKEERVRNQ